MTDTLTTIANRRSYKGLFYNTAVPREHLTQIMQAGLHAPSGINAQSTSLIAVDQPRLLDDIKCLFARPSIKSAPAMIVVLTERSVHYNGTYYNVQDYSACIENMLLAVTSLGYHSCWLEGQTNAEGVPQAIATLLNVPPHMSVVCVLPIGRAMEGYPERQKKSFCHRAWYNGYHQ